MTDPVSPSSASSTESSSAVAAAGRGTPPLSPLHVVLQSTHSPWRRYVTALGWIGFLVCGLMLLSHRAAHRDYLDRTEGIRERFHSGAESGVDKVAVIAVRGVILEGDGSVKRQIDRVRADRAVKAIVLRVDSPGGTVTASDYLLHHLQRLRKERDLPLVVSMGSIATSGGYYLSMAVGDQQGAIFAEPTTTTGSIGVLVPHYDVSGLLSRFDIVDDSIASHPRKLLLSMTRPMSPDDRQVIEQYVGEAFERFKAIVKSGRPALRQANPDQALRDPQSERDLATGEIFTAVQAQQYGLIDEIGFVEDAIERAMELAGLDAKRVRVVEYQAPLSLSSLMGVAETVAPQGELTALLEMNTPRAYYLTTTLPALISSRREN